MSCGHTADEHSQIIRDLAKKHFTEAERDEIDMEALLIWHAENASS